LNEFRKWRRNNAPFGAGSSCEVVIQIKNAGIRLAITEYARTHEGIVELVRDAYALMKPTAATRIDWARECDVKKSSEEDSTFFFDVSTEAAMADSSPKDQFKMTVRLQSLCSHHSRT
jgi:hypothetical protein